MASKLLVLAVPAQPHAEEAWIFPVGLTEIVEGVEMGVDLCLGRGLGQAWERERERARKTESGVGVSDMHPLPLVLDGVLIL